MKTVGGRQAAGLAIWGRMEMCEVLAMACSALSSFNIRKPSSLAGLLKIWCCGLLLVDFCPLPLLQSCLQCFAEKEYQTESKQNETFGRVIFGTNVIQETWSGRQERSEEAMRQEGTPRGVSAPPILVGPSQLHRRTSSFYIYPYTLKTSRSTVKPYFHRRNLLYP